MHVEDKQTEETWVIVAAAGESLRMGLPDGESKQFLLLGGEPILSHSVRRLLAMSTVDGLVVVLVQMVLERAHQLVRLKLALLLLAHLAHQAHHNRRVVLVRTD